MLNFFLRYIVEWYTKIERNHPELLHRIRQEKRMDEEAAKMNATNNQWLKFSGPNGSPDKADENNDEN